MDFILNGPLNLRQIIHFFFFSFFFVYFFSFFFFKGFEFNDSEKEVLDFIFEKLRV